MFRNQRGTPPPSKGRLLFLPEGVLANDFLLIAPELFHRGLLRKEYPNHLRR